MDLTDFIKAVIAKAPFGNVKRNLTHAVLAFAAVFVPLLQFSTVSGLQASVTAALPAAIAVLLRSLFVAADPQ